jgi:hypothetical protein
MGRREGAISTRSGGAEASEQLLAFSRGLYPILLRADAAAFSSYLSRWEDVIGDTSELSATPPDQLRRTMVALLRRPQQFGLPAWPATPDQGQAARETPALWPDKGLRHSPPAPGGGPSAAPPALGPESQTEPPPAVPRRGTYQVDMLTGELVPVARGASAGAPGGVAEPPPAPYVAADEAQPPPRRRRPRRPPRGMKQLTFLPALASAE